MDLIALGVPRWFTTSGVILQFIFALVTLLIGFFSYRVYRLTHQRYTGLFTIAFASITVAYFIQAFLNLFIIMGVQSNQLVTAVVPAIQNFTFPLSVIAVSLHVLFMIGGLAILAYVTLKESNPQIYLLFIFLCLVGLITTGALILAFYLMTSIFLLFITFQHYQRHSRRRTKNSMIVYFAFALWFLGTFQLALSIFISTFYLLGHLTVLVGYLLLLASLMRVMTGGNNG